MEETIVKKKKTRKKYNLNDVHIAANARGFTLDESETEYKGTKHKYKLNCPFGHSWEGSFEGLKAGKGCPDCSGSNGERLAKSILEAMFETRFPKKRPNWVLEKVGKRLELDGYNEEKMIAFEYQGVQHYHGYGIFEKNDLKKLQNRDSQKAKACKEQGVNLIVIPFFKKLNDLQGIISHVEHCVSETGLKIPHSWNERKLNYQFYGYSPDLEEIHEIAKSKGGKCKDSYYLNARSPLNFSCKKDHNFKLHANSLRNGNWCWECGGSYPLNIEHVQNLATQRGEICNDDTYINQSKKMNFTCPKGHEYECTTKNYKKGRGCPTCAYASRAQKRSLGIDKMIDFAEINNGKCLSINYVNQKSLIKWQCNACAQIWENSYSAMCARSYFCPSCKNKKKAIKT